MNRNDRSSVAESRVRASGAGGGGPFKKKKHDLDKDFYELGVMTQVVDAMLKHKTTKRIQFTGILAITAMVSDSSTRKKKLLKEDVVLLHISKTIRNFLNSYEYMESLSLFLEQLAVEKSAHKKIIHYELHERLLTVMKKFNGKKQELFNFASLHCLLLLAQGSKSNKKSLKNAEAALAATQVKEQYPENPSIVELADNILKILNKIK